MTWLARPRHGGVRRRAGAGLDPQERAERAAAGTGRAAGRHAGAGHAVEARGTGAGLAAWACCWASGLCTRPVFESV